MGMKLLNMFNGIIYKTGTISKIDKRKDGINIFFDTSLKTSSARHFDLEYESFGLNFVLLLKG